MHTLFNFFQLQYFLVYDNNNNHHSFIKSLDSQSLSPLDKEKSVETEILRLPQELNDKIFQLAEDRSQGLLIKLQ